MATIDILRRRILMAQAKADEYEGVILGQLQPSPYLVTEIVIAVTPLIEIPSGCTVIRAYTYGHYTAGCRGVILNEDKTYAGMGNATGATGQIYISGIAATAKYFQMAFNIDRIDDCAVKDETHGIYLWKGKNV